MNIVPLLGAPKNGGRSFGYLILDSILSSGPSIGFCDLLSCNLLDNTGPPPPIPALSSTSPKGLSGFWENGYIVASRLIVSRDRGLHACWTHL